MPKKARVRYSEPNKILRGTWLSSSWAKKVCVTVSCPMCRAAKTWPCTSLVRGMPSSTPHAARWEKYRGTQAE